MDTSPNQISEIEFEELLVAASQAGRNSLQVLSGGRELALRPSDAARDDDSRGTPRE